MTQLWLKIVLFSSKYGARSLFTKLGKSNSWHNFDLDSDYVTFGRLIVFAPFLIIIIIIIKFPKQRLETYCFCFLSSSYYYYSFFPWTMNLSTADLRNYWTEFHETWWSYRFVVKGVKAIFLGFKGGGGYYRILWETWNFVHYCW